MTTMTDEQLAACQDQHIRICSEMNSQGNYGPDYHDFQKGFSAGLAFRQGETEERAWLIEMVEARWGTGYFFTGFRGYASWGTIEHAIRFSRKEDADRAIASLPTGPTYEACEHMWPSPAQSAPEPQDDEVPDGYFDALSKAIKAADKLPEQDISDDPPAIPSGGADTYETHVAIREGHRNVAEDEYFAARPQIDGNDRRKVFNAGFDRGFDAAEKHFQAQAAQEPAAYKAIGRSSGFVSWWPANADMEKLCPADKFIVTPLYTGPAPHADRAVALNALSDDELTEMLDGMVEAHDRYQSPVDRGMAQREEGMRLALVYALSRLAAAPTPPAAPAQSEGESRKHVEAPPICPNCGELGEYKAMGIAHNCGPSKRAKGEQP